MKNRVIWMVALAGWLASGFDGRAVSPDEDVSFSGTVVWKTLEAGFYSIEADDGARYVPLNLPAEFKVDGQRIQVFARVRSDMAGVQMRGRIIEIVDISQLPPTVEQNSEP